MKMTRLITWNCPARTVGAACAAFAFLLTTPACNRDAATDAPPSVPGSQPATAPARHVPTLDFSTEIRASSPVVAEFLDEFLNAWFTTDYLAYRRLVSRTYTPESRERFELICEGAAAVRVEAIELIDSPQYPDGTYRVVLDVELTPEAAQRRREVDRKVAILVFQELDQWRMAPAPAEFQPDNEPPTTAPADAETAESEATPDPAATAPAYPWDADGDY